MPLRFRVDTKDRCVYVVGEPPLTDADLTGYPQELAAHPDHGAGFDQLLDMRSLDPSAVTPAGVASAGRLTEAFAEHLRGTRCALVVSRTLSVGLARMFGAYVVEGMEVGVFEDLEEARAWLWGPRPER